MRGGANHFFNGALCTMTLDVCIIAATARFFGLKNWLPVLHVHVYSTGHRQRQNETRSNAFGGQTQTRLRSPRPSKLCWEQSSAQSMISTRSKTAANQLTSLP